MAKAIGKILTPVRVGVVGMIRLALKHWYILILLIVIIPGVLNSIKTARETNNPSYPFVALGLRLTNADQVIYEDVQILRTNPSELIGMEKPENGIWKNFVYGWKFFWNVIWRILGNIWLISFPFVVLYKFFKMKGSKGLQSSTTANMTSALIIGFIFIFIVNIILIAIGYSSLEIPKDAIIFKQAWIVILNSLPFHGVFNLLMYLLGII